MDKDAVLTYILEPGDMPTLLRGELPVSVISSNRYISQSTPAAQLTDRHVEDKPPSLDHTISTALSGGARAVILMGREGSGKTTALEKLVVDWAKGELLQNFSHVSYFRLTEVNSLEGELSLETLMQHHHSHIPPESMHLVLQKPEGVLFVFDDLDQYKPSLDASVHNLCTDPGQAASVSCLLSSLLHGSLLKGAAFVVATRPTGRLKFLDGTWVEVLGFVKPQREAYFHVYFSDQATANKALIHMERTLGFYDFCSSPRFCWTVCSIYKTLMDAGAELPETLSQLYVDILVHLVQALSLNEASSRELVLALGRMASHRSLDQHPSCTREKLDSFGLQPFFSSVGAFLQVDGELDSDACVFSFASQLTQEFIMAVSFFLDKSASEGVGKMLEEHKGHAKFLELFLSGLSEPTQRRPLETLLGEFNSGRITDFKCGFKSSSEETLKGWSKDEHHRCFHLLHQAQNKSLVKEIITPSARTGISYGDLSLRDCVALNYVVSCLGEMELLNLYRTRDLTEEKAEFLAPAMSLSHKILLSNSSLSPGAVPHLASALSSGLTAELDLSHSHLGDERLKALCAGLRDCKLHTLKLGSCRLTEASCEDLVSALTSGSSQLCVLDIMFNKIGDQGFVKLCRALQSPQCKLQELQLQGCDLTAASMEVLSAALCRGKSELRRVNLTLNRIGDIGVEALCKGLQHALCKLQSLTLKRCELTQPVFKELGSLLRRGTSRLKSLTVGLNKVGDQGVKHLWEAVAHPSCLLEELDVEMTNLTDACVEDLCAAVRASKTLKNLELRNNSLTDTSVPALIQVMEDSSNMLEMNLKYNDISEEVFDMLSECDKMRF
ncbi:NACHT, LRR and PYD domains-containing protein 14 isoform X2 [Scophthalmus maximus]|uniref:NACHT, LRR and PYD domains-containing protein 14 isoform X2 n=1 Tax=Scophthalmus maximus TaxID=52904 RepID=UPI001FA8614A|nr:NACHT, LRR and PYD domains-containing protein 14 isoform X2 [Scophthalmus maximus]